MVKHVIVWTLNDEYSDAEYYSDYYYDYDDECPL